MGFIRFKRLLVKEDGAVTVFAVIVLASLLMFFSVLIDYARIAVFQLKTENVSRTAVRSVLSAYDSWLYERYGLFGRGGTVGEEIFAKVLEGNQAADGSGGVDLIASRIESAVIQTASVLGNHEVFARQVLEDMKYKAPIDFTLEVVAKFKPLSGVLSESSNTINTLEQLRKLYEKREDLLERALRLQEQAVDTVLSSEALALVPAGGSSRVEETALSLAQGFGSYVIQTEQASAQGEGANPLYHHAIAQYESDVSDMMNQLRHQNEQLKRLHAELLTDAMVKLEAAERLNSQMKRVVELANPSAVEQYAKVAGANVPGSEDYSVPGSAAQELEDVKKSGEKLMRTPEWFTAYKTELLEQGTRSIAFTSEVEQLLGRWSVVMAKPLNPVQQSFLLMGVVEAGDAISAYSHHYSLPGSILKERRETVLDSSIKDQLAEQKNKTESLWVEASRMLHGLSGVSVQPEHNEQYQQIKHRYEQNLLFNPSANDELEGFGIRIAEHASHAAEQSANMMDQLYSGMSQMLQQNRNAYYFGEYAAQRFSYFAPQQLRMLLENGDVEGVTQMASFHNQEMEYVLYGFHEPLGNLIAAYGELFSVRLAIRTMEGLIVSRTLGHPLLVLSSGIIYGLEKTMEDMFSFAEKGKAPLSKYVQAELSYLDYLRLFMLLHSRDERKRTARMIAVIEQNTGLILSLVPVGVTGEANISMKLWFLPGIMSILGRFDLLQGKVVGNRYETSHTVGWSYS